QQLHRAVHFVCQSVLLILQAWRSACPGLKRQHKHHAHEQKEYGYHPALRLYAGSLRQRLVSMKKSFKSLSSYWVTSLCLRTDTLPDTLRIVKMSETPIPDGRITRWDAHRRKRRNDLIRSARAAVHTIGPTVAMEELANHAGTSKSVFYRYFEDKQGLQQAVAQA